MSFLYPTYLWAFLGLLVPLFIHLWSKREGRTIKIGSVQLLRESDPKQSSSFRLNEWWLLLLRMLLVSLLILIMAAPRLNWREDWSRVVYLVEPSLIANTALGSLLDSLMENENVRLLAPGFPELDRSIARDERDIPPNYWQLAQQMQGLPTDSVVVFTNAYVSGIKGMRPKVNQNINWVVLDHLGSEDAVVEAVKMENGLQLRSVASDRHSLSFYKTLVDLGSNRVVFDPSKDSVTLPEEKGKMLPLLFPRPVQVLIRKVDSLSGEAAYLEASFAAISTYLKRDFKVRVSPHTDTLDLATYDLVVWLGGKPQRHIPTKLLLYNPDSLAQKLIEKAPSKNIFYLTAPLDAENIVEGHLPERLLQLLDLHQNLKGKIRKYDRRVVDSGTLQPIMGEGNGQIKVGMPDISSYLWMLLLLFLVAERIVARVRKQ